MKTRAKLQVKEVAALAGVSVRTLHHYDEIGLLVPKGRSSAGYRLYDGSDLLRLQQIMLGRELGMPLEAIRHSLDDPRFDRRAALLTQRKQLEERSAQTVRMIAAVDAALALLDEGEREDADQERGEEKGKEAIMKSMFEGFDPSKHEAEAERRWGNTEAFKVSRERTKSYGPEDWKKLGAEQAAIYADAARAMAAGKSPSSDEAMDIAERHRLSIDRWFYPCSGAMHCGLADLYENDARFAANIDKHGEGLTAFLAAAIRANAERVRAE
jgi:DNA-binding transcriptional MerR regulator